MVSSQIMGDKLFVISCYLTAVRKIWVIASRYQTGKESVNFPLSSHNIAVDACSFCNYLTRTQPGVLSQPIISRDREANIGSAALVKERS